MSLRIDPDTVYTKRDLAEALNSVGIDVDLFLGRVKPKKVFRSCWLGSDILEALRRAPKLSERKALSAPRNKGNRTSPKKSSASPPGKRFGGVFTPEEVGL